MRAILHRLGWLVRRRRLESDLDEEIRLHFEEEVAHRIAAGVSPAEARRVALRDFGRVAEVKEDARSVRGVPPLERWARDLRFAGRGLRRAPGAIGVAAATLALALAALTAVAAIVDRLFLTPLPYPAPDRLAVAWEYRAGRQVPNVVSADNFAAWRERARSFAGLAGLVPDHRDLLAGGAERIAGAAVSPAWFEVLRVAPGLGRPFTEEEARREAPVIVLSDGLWRERFGADPGVIGRVARFGDEALEVVGVMPAGFEPPAFGWLGAEQRYWVPFAPNEANQRWGRFLLVLGRLRDGIAVESADAELAAIAADLAATDPRNRSWSAGVRGLAGEITGDARPALMALAVAAGGLIIAGTANLALTLVARARRRREELAIRLALGGTRRRVAGQLVAEAALIGLVAGPVGIGLGAALVRWLAAARLDLLPRSTTLAVSGETVLLVALATAAGAAFAGLAAATAIPAGATRFWLATRGDGGGLRATRGLIVTEVAVAVLLTVVAGLAARSFLALRAARLGFVPERVTALRISLPPSRYPEARARAFFGEVADRVRAMPGVTRVGLIDYRPYHPAGPATHVGRLGEPIDPATSPVADLRLADPDYFETLRITRTRAAGGPPDAVWISRYLAETLWPGMDPAGRRLQVGMSAGDSVTVTGVVDDVLLHGPRRPVRGAIYFPVESRPLSELDLMVRSESGIEVLVPQVRSAVAAIDPTIAIHSIETLDRAVAAAVVGDRVASWTLSWFSLVSLLVAAGGVAAVLLVELSRRRRELGVRIALGAGPREVRRTVVRSGLRLIVPGLGLGAGAAALFVPVVRASMPGTTATDPVALAGVVAVLLVAVAGALAGPVYRATTVEPIEVLRGD